MKAGTRLGRYEIVARIGAGGMGEVYRAHDSVLERDVAVKVLADSVEHNRSLLTRFEQEARAVAALSHPNILAIYDVGKTEGLPFAVMELLEGETLEERLVAGPLPWELTVSFTRQVVRALGAAHAKRIVHRDLKPSNIFLAKPGDVIKILDFGLAKVEAPAIGDEEETAVRATTPGTMLGTMAYMSPEQVRGGNVDHRSDIFSLGAVMFELLTGRALFAMPTAADTLAAVLSLELPRPALPGDLPNDLVELIERCVQKDPDERFPSCEALGAALDRIRSAADPSPPPHPEPLPASARSIAVLPFTDMSPGQDLGYFCHGMAEEIIDALAKLGGLHVIARTSAFRFAGEDVRKIGQELRVDNVLLGSVRAAGERLRVGVQLVKTADEIYLWSERFDRGMEDVFSVQDEIAATVADSLRVQLGTDTDEPAKPRQLSPDAYTWFLKGRHQINRRTASTITNGIDCFRKAIDVAPSYADGHIGIAEANSLLAVYGLRTPLDVMPKAKDAALKALQLDERSGRALALLACNYAIFEWDWLEAESCFRRAIEIEPTDPSIRQQYAMNVLVPLRRFEDAESQLRLALASDPVSVTINASIGLRFYYDGRYESAEEWFSNALGIDERFGMALLFLGLTHAEMGAHDKAVEELETAIRESDESPETRAGLAYACALDGRVDRAREIQRELQELEERRYASPSLRAQIHAGLGELEPALELLEKAQQTRTADLAWAAVRPVFSRLRGQPRFQALLEALGTA